MATVVGLGLLALGILCLTCRWLGEPDTRVEGPSCPNCGWPPWSVMPCLCPEEERGPEFQGTGPII